MRNVTRHRRLLLRPEDFVPSDDDWDVIGTFNPGAAILDGQVVLLVRVAERPRERRSGYVALPRWDGNHVRVIDWVREDAVEAVDPRVVRVKATGLARLTSVSHLSVVYCGDGREVERVGTAFFPQGDCETYGVEDPRITYADGRYYITYVAVSRHGAATALASTRDFVSFQRHGIIFPPENKDVVFFPEQLDGCYTALHRPNGATPFTSPEMWLARSDDLIQWGWHEPLTAGWADWESGRVGAGAPPIRVEQGWLAIYHGNRRPTRPGDVGSYQAGALLLDADDPARVLRRSVEPILTPTEAFEREGFVPDVVFPTGIVERGDSLLLYYGAGDTYAAMTEMSVAELKRALKPLD